MFEDMYDYFKASPAYMPSFEKSAFWGQLSNLINHGDQIFDNDASDAYLVGGQTPVGPGRLGLMLDWYSNEDPRYNQIYNGYGHYGFGEGTYEQYLDRDNDEILDARRETYGCSDYTDKEASMDVYAAYALGGFMGFDLGAGVRGVWSAENPTYWDSPLFGYKDSFVLNSYNRQYDLATGRLLYDWSEQSSGSYTDGSGIWALILGARSKSLLPGLDLVANLAPVLYSWNNKVDWNYTSFTNYDPANVDDYSITRSYQGIDDDFGADHPLTGSSLGVYANVRGDYALTPGVLLTAELGGLTIGWNPKDEKAESTASTIRRTNALIGGVPTVQTTTSDEVNTTTLEEKGGIGAAYLNLRAQFPANGWRLGLGLNTSVAGSNNEVMKTYSSNETVRWNPNDGTPASGGTTVTTYSEQVKHTYDGIANVLELPVGIIVDLLSNLQLQLGAKHTIEVSSLTEKTNLVSQSMETAVYTADNGYSFTNIDPPSGFVDTNETEYSVEQYTSLYYGVTWRPYEQVQIDFAGFGDDNLLDLDNWRLSVNIYF